MSANTNDGTGPLPTIDTLRDRRSTLGLSRFELAVRAKCSPGYIQLLEQGYRPARGTVLPRVERALAAAEAAQNDSSPAATGLLRSEVRGAVALPTR